VLASVTDDRRPDFYLVGAPKSGTTAMYEYLRKHPGLFLPERKELRYFGRDLEIRDRVQLSLQDYLAHFVDAPRDALIGTAYVWYLYSRTAAAEIADFSPEARIIVMLRDPVDMLPALHAEHLTNGNEDIRDFEAALRAEPERKAGRLIPAHAHLPQGLLYSEVPRYAEQVERFVAAFGRERVHVILFDEFVASPADAYRSTLAFLGASGDFQPDTFAVVNANRRLRSERLRHFLARPPGAVRLVARRVVPRRLRQAGHSRLKNLNTVTAPRAPLSNRLDYRLRAQFSEEIDRLEALLGRDLGAWRAGVAGARTHRGESVTASE
jgi:hypothetical protein